MDIFPRETNYLPAVPGISPHILSKEHRDVPRILTEKQLLSQVYPDVTNRATDSTADLAKIVSGEAGMQSHEQDLEIGYEDEPHPSTFEGLERRFQDEIFSLIKEQADAEDAENTRHKEKLIEINNKYKEKLSSLRAQQAN